jgi:hypothetical protein
MTPSPHDLMLYALAAALIAIGVAALILALTDAINSAAERRQRDWALQIDEKRAATEASRLMHKIERTEKLDAQWDAQTAKRAPQIVRAIRSKAKP